MCCSNATVSDAIGNLQRALQRTVLHTCFADDVDLVRWVKAQQPWLSSPPTAPPSGPVGCWRDPFIIQRPSSSNDGRRGRPHRRSSRSSGDFAGVLI